MDPQQTTVPLSPAEPPYIHDDHTSASHSREHVADPSGREAALQTLRRGPRGAAAVASIALSIVLALWMLFYFLVFLPRGAVE